MIKINFDEHSFGLIEAQIYNDGEYADRNITARDIFEVARNLALNEYGLNPEERTAKVAKIKRLEKRAIEFGWMNVWYLHNWGEQNGGYRVHRQVQIRTR